MSLLKNNVGIRILQSAALENGGISIPLQWTQPALPGLMLLAQHIICIVASALSNETTVHSQSKVLPDSRRWISDAVTGSVQLWVAVAPFLRGISLFP